MATRKTAKSTKTARKAENQKALKKESKKAHSIPTLGWPGSSRYEAVTAKQKAESISSARGAKIARAKAKKKK